MFVSAILAAGGRGTRLGSDIPKQLLTLGDRTILQRSFDLVESHERIDEIVVALPRDLAASPPPYLVSAQKARAYRRWGIPASGFGGQCVCAGVRRAQV